MEYVRDTKEFREEQERIINKLVEEVMSGKVKMDTLKEEGRSLFCPEAEAMYFLAFRNFLETSIAHRVMNRKQDVFSLSLVKKRG